MRIGSGHWSRTRFRRVDAVLARHALVAQDDLHHLAGQHVLGLRRPAHGDDLELLRQHAADRLEAADLVVDDEHRGIARHHCSPDWLTIVPLDRHQQMRGNCSPDSQSTMRPPPNDVVICTKN